MENVSFNTLAAGWNRIIANGAPNLRKLVSGMIDPGQIQMQSIAENPTDMTIAFSGFDQALENSERDAPILKKAILAWMKNFVKQIAGTAQVQIARGDPNTFMIKITTISAPMAQTSPAPSPQMESINKGNLVHISNMRKVNA
jgi:hypothetical protein